MVFSSIPVYVDPPNWHHQHANNLQQQGNNVTDSPHLLPPLPPQAVPTAPPVGNGIGSIRPGSMADRARLAKIPPPEAALKCPRCDSTNTKFCYFNNYSLSQPRHFCKACRRYWTRGGALRNVPVGGGCRRNKKNKRSRSKSPGNAEKQVALANNPSMIPPPPGGGGATHELIGHHHQLPQPQNLPFMASLQNLSRYGVGSMEQIGFQIGGNSAPSSSGNNGLDHWRLQHFPFLNGFDPNSSSSSAAAAASYPFQNDQGMNDAPANNSGLVKMEENGAMSLIPRSNLNNNNNNNNNQFYTSWGNDMSGLASSSTTHHNLL